MLVRDTSFDRILHASTVNVITQWPPSLQVSHPRIICLDTHSWQFATPAAVEVHSNGLNEVTRLLFPSQTT